MARSLKKGPFCDEHLFKKVEALNESKKKAIEDLKDSNSKIKNIDVNKGEDSYGEI